MSDGVRIGLKNAVRWQKWVIFYFHYNRFIMIFLYRFFSFFLKWIYSLNWLVRAALSRWLRNSLGPATETLRLQFPGSSRDELRNPKKKSNEHQSNKEGEEVKEEVKEEEEVIIYQIKKMVTPTNTRKREPMAIMATIQMLNSPSSVGYLFH